MVNVTPQTTNTELSQIIADEIRKRGANNIYRFRIRGMRGRISALTWIFSPVSGILSRSWTSRSHSMISTHCSRNIQAT